ncbi:outer membrane beta-barrel protein [Pseudalgibacter alginicilyticus]|nr:outer membrane beta-barrel family protein [Pseudalgibacter alginicilyticus]
MVVKFLSFIIIFFSMLTYGQEFTIRGQVNNSENTPIAFANVTAMSSDSLNLGVITSENGHFVISNLKKKIYTLKVSFIGFKTYETTLLVDKDIDFGILILEENIEQLHGITIIAKNPTVKRLVDRFIFNVENSTLSNGNVLDILKHTPGVLINEEKITVKNGEPTIYINDRKVHLSSSEVLQLLEGTSADNIKSVEVITNPPAKYEAEGGSVLNIITKKNIISGYNGSILGSVKHGSEFPKYSLGSSHFFKTKKISTYLNYNINPKKDYINNTEFINFIDNNSVVSSWETAYEKRQKFSNHNINGSIIYDLDDHNSFGFFTNLLFAPRDNTKMDVYSSTEIYDFDSELESTFNTLNKSVNEIFNFAFTLDYAHKFKREGEKISANIHHTNYDFSSFQNVDTDYFYPNEIEPYLNNRFQTFSSQVIKLYTGQMDYELPISDSSEFEAGLKISSIDSENIIRQYIYEDEVKQDDINNSDTFLYDEMNYAIYSSFSNQTDNWSIKAGLRVEYTNLEGNSLTTDQDNVQHYVKFFPALSILKNLNKKNTLYIEYNRRIYRPRYQELNPFKFFLNDNVYTTGDPKLKPQIDDVFTLGYTFNKKYTLEAYYRYENNPTLEIVFQDNDTNILKYINTNIDTSISYGLDFSTYTKIINRWHMNAMASLFYYGNKFYALESNNTLESKNKWSVYFEIGNYFSFLKDNSLTADVSLLYISPYADGPSIISDRLGLDINLRKSLWKNRASISLGVSDIFNTKNYNQTTKYLNQDILLKSRIENRLVMFGFNYKFGNTHLKNNQKEIDLEERNRLGSKKNNH